MKYLFLILLSGCAVQTEIRKDAVHPEILNKPEAIVVKPEAVHIESGAVQSTIGIPVTGTLNIQKGAVAIPINATIQQEAIHIPVTGTVQSGAIQIPISIPINIPPETIKFVIETGAIQIQGLEKGSVQTQIEMPWWSWLVGAGLGLGWLITKFRRHVHAPEIRSAKDILF